MLPDTGCVQVRFHQTFRAFTSASITLRIEFNPQKGYGDIIPRTILETCVQLAVVITGACLFASTVSADAKLT